MPMEDVSCRSRAFEELRTRLVRALIALGIRFRRLLPGRRAAEYCSSRDPNGRRARRAVIGTAREAFFTSEGRSSAASPRDPVLFYQIWRFVAPGLYEHEALLKAFVSSAPLLRLRRYFATVRVPDRVRLFIDEYASVRSRRS